MNETLTAAETLEALGTTRLVVELAATVSRDRGWSLYEMLTEVSVETEEDEAGGAM